MKPKLLFTVTLAAALLTPSLRAEETNKWAFDVSLYGLLAGMSGTAGLGPVNANVDVGFEHIWDNLKAGGMGTARVGYGRWAVSTDVIYMNLEATKDPFTVQAKQWLVQPQLEYSFCRYFGVYSGARYNNIDLELHGPLGVNPSSTQGWWDPVIGTRIRLPFAKKFSFDVSGDIGGFNVGSDFSWQVFPCFNWQFKRWGSMQAGYRWLSADYETGSGLNRFKYDVVSQGPQIGVTFHF
jgi:hypothetical protein